MVQVVGNAGASKVPQTGSELAHCNSLTVAALRAIAATYLMVCAVGGGVAHHALVGLAHHHVVQV